MDVNEQILAFDLCLDHLDVVLMTPKGEIRMPHHCYDNNLPGSQQLKHDVLPLLAGLPNVQLTAAAESTGSLWWHIFYQIVTDPDYAPYNPRLALLNPKQVKHYRKVTAEEDKIDPKDAPLVGDFYRAVGVKHYTTFDWRYLPLRFFTRAYFRVVHALAAEKAYALSLVYLKASEYTRLKPFGQHLSVTSRHILTENPDIAALADIPLDQLAEEVDAIVHTPLKDADESARRLHQIAYDSYPVPDDLLRVVNPILALTLDHIRLLERHRKQYRRWIENELDHLPEARLALEHKGLGSILVGGALGEIQDVRRFTSGLKYDHKLKRERERTYKDGQASVAKLAGLWWPRSGSGRFESDERHLARNRNPYLRYWFVQSAYCLKGRQQEYRDYYRRKYNETPKHKHKRALILTARKAARLIFALLHKGQLERLKEDNDT